MQPNLALFFVVMALFCAAAVALHTCQMDVIIEDKIP